MGIGKTNKRKGSNAERFYAIEFRNLGFSKCQTARFGSKFMDDAGIDLINLPMNVQIKAGKQRGLNPCKLLKEIKAKIKDLLMPNALEQEYPLILIHKKEVGQGIKREEHDELVTMSFEDFKKIIKKIDKW